MFKKTVLSNFVSAFLLFGTLAAGTAYAQGAAKPELKVGFVPGPYIDGFKAGVAPELQKKARSANVASINRLARRNAGSFVIQLETCQSFFACSSIAFTIAGWQCPRAVTATPLAKSMYMRPS